MKISEGSVRDALSLLDRGLLALDKDKELNLTEAQKIFGYFDKSQLIDIFRLVLEGQEKKVIEAYKKIYNQGIEPKVFINDFLELVYYFKNIKSLTPESTNFSLNDEEFSKIKEISENIDEQVLILFWQFTLKTVEELDIVLNQNLSIEMFLIRLMYLVSPDLKAKEANNNNSKKSVENKDTLSDIKTDTVNQIKNVSQEKKINLELQSEIKAEGNVLIGSFDKLLNVCFEKKEMKLKYELEKNVNLVSFNQNRIEISFNDNLDKNFVKDLSLKLYEWTGERWIITFSKTKGQISIKEKQNNKKKELIKEAKDSVLYKTVLEKFSDANLIDVVQKDKEK